MRESQISRVPENLCSKAPNPNNSDAIVRENKTSWEIPSRHSRFVTCLIGNGVSLRNIQEILLSMSTETTEIHMHVNTASLTNIKNPLDSRMERVMMSDTLIVIGNG